eukprot:GHVR01045898.1.p1 GENE.GHVR01045898.1~~GHVR01045898.1.p1  ORF type:complete len:157 (+),score=18.98 GHVR01045898.1:465-935(+)
MSGWLLLKPIAADNTLAPDEFRDAIALRYGKALTRQPPKCEGCGTTLSTSHTLDCKVGGQVIRRHNDITNKMAEIMSCAYTNVQKEVVLKDRTPKDALVADVKARGVWQAQTDTLFDIAVIDSDAPSHANKEPTAVLAHYFLYFHKRNTKNSTKLV